MNRAPAISASESCRDRLSTGTGAVCGSIGATFLRQLLGKEVAPMELHEPNWHASYRQVVPTGLAHVHSSRKLDVAETIIERVVPTGLARSTMFDSNGDNGCILPPITINVTDY